MIAKAELLEAAKSFGLLPQVVEKDYVLGWILWAIYNNQQLSEIWIFKGGTCLKKAYFETYRFSEDLDFTVLNADGQNESFLRRVFSEIASSVYDRCGIELPSESFYLNCFKNDRGDQQAEVRVGYRGPLGQRGDLPRLKLDLLAGEPVVAEPQKRLIHHPYADCPESGIYSLCYCYEEVFAEKTRALGERARPRDLYDVISMYRNQDLTPDLKILRSILKQKCRHKGIEVPTFEGIDAHPKKQELISEWANMLAHQLPRLPDFQSYWVELPKFFEWVHEVTARPVLQTLPSREQVVRNLPTSPMRGRPPALETIRFAAANRFLVDLTYQGKKRLIEPYSFRRSSSGRLLLYAIKPDTGETRAYGVDEIQHAEATSTKFLPRYRIELNEAPRPIARQIGRAHV